MKQHQRIQRVLLLAPVIAVLASMSAFADDRLGWRTVGSEVAVEARRTAADLEGVVVSVDPSGDSFVLRTGRRTVHVQAKGGVPAYYGERRYRIRDLERGDRVAVDLVSARGALRARSVRVLESVSHRGGYGLDGRRGTLLEGRIVGLDPRRDRIVVRGDRGRPITVDGRRLDRSHGRAWARGLRVGEPVRIHGSFNRRGVFVAEWLGADRRHDRGRGRRR